MKVVDIITVLSDAQLECWNVRGCVLLDGF
jgi:hypothetical protein